MDVHSAIMTELRAMIKKEMINTLWPAEVISVNESEMTCDVANIEEIEHYDVRLRATVDGADNHAVLIPKVGSWVIVGALGDDDTEFCVLRISEIEKALIKVGTVELEVDSAGMKYSKGADDLKSLLGDMLAAIKLITVTAPSGVTSTPINAAVFTALENRVNQLLK